MELRHFKNGAWETLNASNSGLLEGHNAAYFATAASVTNIINGTTKVGNAAKLDGLSSSDFIRSTASCNKNWNWYGQSGQPPWLWGSSDGQNMYVYNPSNFSVNYANSAGSVAWGNVIDKPSTYNPSTHTHDYLPLSGGTITGNLKVNTTLNSVNYQENGTNGHLVSITATAPANTNMLWTW